jgi:hypothetical protein
MKDFAKLNNIIGWAVGIAASLVFILTAESTASFWDCGEFISCAYKFEVGHPPGAPTFLILGRIVSLFTFGNTALVGLFINYLSAVCSGLAVMFAFWIITYLGRKLFANESDQQFETGNNYAVLGAGIVGAMALTFCDSFWFSAVEGEVYSMAAFFTAIIFWCATKWDRETEEKNSFRWVILIGFLIGLSIGVHLLNLLAIPAIGYLYYFKKHANPTWKGIVFTTLVSVGVTGLILEIIIPQVVNLFAKSELLFVNVFGMPFNSGTIILTLAIIAAIYFGLKYTIKKQKALLNTIILAFMFLLIGYSTYLILVIRSNANTPLNENAPKDAIALLSYLNREQYGDWPVTYGQYYNAPIDSKNPYSDGNPLYCRDDKKGKYVIIDDRKGSVPNYDSRFCTIFPRMWKSEKADDYKNWVDIKGTPISVTYNGESQVITKPTFGENLQFFWRYQIGYMYWRYFLWNFVGRQNDVQGFGDPVDGNWVSGIDAIDKSLVGPVDLLPSNLRNKGANHFYFLPLILGLIGMFYQFRKRYQDGLVVLLFFFMTGLAIILYLNQGPNEPRERDYAYAGSMMAFCMWIGLGVIGIYSFLRNKLNPKIVAIAVTLICFMAVPYVMGKNGWNDHDRSGRYTMRDFAANYLNSCEPNAILFTNGDNDTFPLWYAQEVEGIRTDVRVVNLSLLNTDWYIDAMKRKAYDSDALPISMTWDQYKSGTRDAVYFYENQNVKGSVELSELLDFALSDNPSTKLTTSSGRKVDYFPSRNFKLTIDKKAVLASGTVSKDQADSIVDKMEWKISGYGVQKNNLAALDIIAHNNWKRPIYFSITTGTDSYIGLENYFQLEGLAYHLVPIKNKGQDGQTGVVNTAAMYNHVMNKFKWGNVQDSTVYLDETNLRMTMNFRNNFARLASALADEGKKDSAIKVLDRCLEVMPESSVPYNWFIVPIAEAYYKAGDTIKANKIVTRMINLYEQNLIYFFAFKGTMATAIKDRKEQSLAIVNRLSILATTYKQDAVAKKAKDLFEKFYEVYMQSESATDKPIKKK